MDRLCDGFVVTRPDPRLPDLPAPEASSALPAQLTRGRPDLFQEWWMIYGSGQYHAWLQKQI